LAAVNWFSDDTSNRTPGAGGTKAKVVPITVPMGRLPHPHPDHNRQE